MILTRESVAESLIVETLDLLLEARALEGQLLVVPQRDLTAHTLLRGGRVPREVVDQLLSRMDAWLLATGHMLAEGLKDRRIDALKREAV
jgi:hypothetical protein